MLLQQGMLLLLELIAAAVQRHPGTLPVPVRLCLGTSGDVVSPASDAASEAGASAVETAAAAAAALVAPADAETAVPEEAAPVPGSGVRRCTQDITVHTKLANQQQLLCNSEPLLYLKNISTRLCPLLEPRALQHKCYNHTTRC